MKSCIRIANVAGVCVPGLAQALRDADQERIEAANCETGGLRTQQKERDTSARGESMFARRLWKPHRPELGRYRAPCRGLV